jgi:class 3 adenylate cyclase
MPRTDQRRRLQAVTFVDTVGSTRIAAELGDQRWQIILRKELVLLRNLLKEHGGREVDVAGDGLFAVFDEPASAVRFAARAAGAVRKIGLEIRAGIHFGECEFAEGHPSGIVVHTGARTMSVAGPGEVTVTQTVRDLVSGGGLRFEDRGVHELKGVPGTWTIFGLTASDGEPVAGPLGDTEAAERRLEASAPMPVVRRRMLITAVTAAILASSVLTYLLAREPTRSPSLPSGINRLLRLDPASGDVRLLPGLLPHLSGELPGLAVGEGGVWAVDTIVHHIDLTDMTREGVVEDVSSVYQRSTRAVATGFDDLWVAVGPSLYRIDPADDEVVDRRDFPGLSTSIATGMAVGVDAVWVTKTDGTLFRIDPTEGLRVEETIELGGSLSDVTIADDAVWIADEFGDVIRVDPARNRETDRIHVSGTPKALAATTEHLWIVDPAGLVTVIDLRTRSIRKVINVGGRPVDVAVGLDAIWVADEGRDRVMKLTESTLEEEDHYPIGGPAAAIAIDETQGVIWVRTSGGRTKA